MPFFFTTGTFSLHVYMSSAWRNSERSSKFIYIMNFSIFFCYSTCKISVIKHRCMFSLKLNFNKRLLKLNKRKYMFSSDFQLFLIIFKKGYYLIITDMEFLICFSWFVTCKNSGETPAQFNYEKQIDRMLIKRASVKFFSSEILLN